MRKEFFLPIVFIPILAIVISYFSGMITYQKYSAMELIAATSYFILVSACIWIGCQFIHSRLRQLNWNIGNPVTKIATVTTVSGFYGLCTAALFGAIWMQFSKEVVALKPQLVFTLLSFVAVIIFTLLYEIVYLSKERQRDTIIVDQLDQELQKAEMTALRNEIEPHFIFNSLNTLSHLIASDSQKANLFNDTLAQVYKYFLLNKSKDLVPADDEINFVKQYIMLLRVRLDNHLELHFNFDEKQLSQWRIIPFSSQLLIENVLKHNDLTATHPLQITLSLENDHLLFENSIVPKRIKIESTKVGLRNLSAQYDLLSKKSLSVENKGDRFVVKLPLFKA
ncbi:MAG: histidine kinase [Ginsengibacter sp.]